MNPNIAKTRKQKAAQCENGGNRYPSKQEINVGESERWVSVFAGGFLAACGLLRGSTSGLALAALGGALAYRGYTGHCQLYEAIGHCSSNTM